MVNVYLEKPVIKILGEKEVEIHYDRPISIHNFTSVINNSGATTTSGIVYFSTYPETGGIQNNRLGAVASLNTTTSGIQRFNSLNIETNLRRAGVPISGSQLVGG